MLSNFFGEFSTPILNRIPLSSTTTTLFSSSPLRKRGPSHHRISALPPLSPTDNLLIPILIIRILAQPLRRSVSNSNSNNVPLLLASMHACCAVALLYVAPLPFSAFSPSSDSGFHSASRDGLQLFKLDGLHGLIPLTQHETLLGYFNLVV